MIKGMTGFGSSEISTGDIKAIIEVKSLNHRYFDINFFLPIGFGSVENKIKQAVQKQIERGRVTVSIKITEKPMQAIVLNKSAVKKYLNYARSLRKELHLKDNISLPDLMKMPGVFESKETLVNADKMWRAMDKGIQKSLKELVAMRKREGRSLRDDVNDKLRRMSVQIGKVRARSKIVLREKKKKLTDEEFQGYQRSSDINEEISRLTHYVAELRGLLKSDISVGKRMDFVAQEMQRETNTIGSKLQDKVVSNAVIALKSKIEKIREQAQNIE